MSGIVGDNLFRASGVVATNATSYDDDVIQSNIALLGFYVAVNGSLVRYNLVDQSIDEYFDTSGVDASASVNDERSAASPHYYYGGATVTPTVTQNADAVTTDGDYTVYKWTTVTSSGSYNNNTTQSHEWLVVAGGGGGAGGATGNGGGGGAGGYRTGTTLSLTGGTGYTITVGDGGAGVTTGDGNSGDDSVISGTGITTITSDGGGGGGRGEGSGVTGGSGGGSGYGHSNTGGAAIAITPYTAAGETTTVQGFDGTDAPGTMPPGAPQWGNGGGGGASETSTDVSSNTSGGDGGVGIQNDIVETDTQVWYAGGGGGGTYGSYAAAGNYGAGANGRTQGGGGYGTGSDKTDVGYMNATDGTGGGGGGGRGSTTGSGGSGIVVLRRLTSVDSTGADFTLQSTDVTAESEPDYGEIVMLIENAYGTSTLNTDIKGYVSRDSGSNFTQGTLVDEGSWGTNKKILAFHDLDISGQPSGTSMCYKITTHNQSSESKEVRIYATSIGWR
jgi:hypothetical protein